MPASSFILPPIGCVMVACRFMVMLRLLDLIWRGLVLVILVGILWGKACFCWLALVVEVVARGGLLLTSLTRRSIVALIGAISPTFFLIGCPGRVSQRLLLLIWIPILILRSPCWLRRRGPFISMIRLLWLRGRRAIFFTWPGIIIVVVVLEIVNDDVLIVQILFSLLSALFVVAAICCFSLTIQLLLVGCGLLIVEVVRFGCQPMAATIILLLVGTRLRLTFAQWSFPISLRLPLLLPVLSCRVLLVAAIRSPSSFHSLILSLIGPRGASPSSAGWIALLAASVAPSRRVAELLLTVHKFSFAASTLLLSPSILPVLVVITTVTVIVIRLLLLVVGIVLALLIFESPSITSKGRLSCTRSGITTALVEVHGFRHTPGVLRAALFILPLIHIFSCFLWTISIIFHSSKCRRRSGCWPIIVVLTKSKLLSKSLLHFSS